MADKEYVKPPNEKDYVESSNEKEYVKPPSEKEYVEPPVRDRGLSSSESGNEKIYERPEQSAAMLEKTQSFYASLKEHLSPEYRKQYNIRRFFGCLILFYILRAVVGTDSIFSIKGIFPYAWSISAWLFWHYAFWSYQGGIIDNFSRSIIYIGSFFSLIWKTIVQNFLILLWISLIAPISGFKTWRKAVKNDSVLYIKNGWNR